MVTVIFKASKFMDNIFIYCRLTLDYIKQSYSTNTLRFRDGVRGAPVGLRLTEHLHDYADVAYAAISIPVFFISITNGFPESKSA